MCKPSGMIEQLQRSDLAFKSWLFCGISSLKMDCRTQKVHSRSQCLLRQLPGQIKKFKKQWTARKEKNAGPMGSTHSPHKCTEIGQYASKHGVAAAAWHYLKRLEMTINESTVPSMKRDHLEALRQRRPAQDQGDLTVLIPHKKHGRPVLLEQELDGMVHTYLKKRRWEVHAL